MLVMLAALGDLMCCGSTSQMLFDGTLFIMMGAICSRQSMSRQSMSSTWASLWPLLSFRPQKAPLPVKEARVLVRPAALGDRMCCGSTSLMLSGETAPFIRLAAISSWLCSLATIAFFSSSCRQVDSVRSSLRAQVLIMVHPPETFFET